jgi:hypothetical protein
MRYLLATVCVLVLAACATTATKESKSRYQSQLGADQRYMVFECQGSTIVGNDCLFRMEGGGRPAEANSQAFFVPMTSQQQYLRRLVSISAQGVLNDPKKPREAPVAEIDMPAIESISSNQDACFAERQYYDLMVACAPSNLRDKLVVVFFRGLCDRCEFQPVVLRKVN